MDLTMIGQNTAKTYKPRAQILLWKEVGNMTTLIMIFITSN